MVFPNKKNDYSRIEQEYAEKDAKKKKKMKVSGASVKKIKKIIKEKGIRLKLFALVLAALYGFFPLFVQGQGEDSEKIENYEIDIRINKNSSLDIEERILYAFGGSPKHGIYRDIPVEYSRQGLNYKVSLSGIRAYNGQNEEQPVKITESGGSLRIRIGDPGKYVSGKENYVIRYRVERALNYFDKHDELYWNAVGSGWDVPVVQSKARVILPRPVAEGDLDMECFSGPYGSSRPCVSKRFEYSGQGKAGSAVFIDDFLEPGNGLTVVLGLPKGTVEEPGIYENIFFYLKNNIFLFAPLAVFGFLYFLWTKYGRDPKGRGTVIHEYEAPEGLCPAELGTVVDETADQRDISAEIIYLAVNGYLKIHQSEKGLIKDRTWILEKLRSADSGLREYQKDLLNALFKEKYIDQYRKRAEKQGVAADNQEDKVSLDDLNQAFYGDYKKIRKKIYQSVTAQEYFSQNPKTARTKYFLASIALVLLLIFLIGFYWSWTLSFWEKAALFASAVILVFFSFIMPKKTAKGSLAKEKILGLKRYLSVAEKDRIDFHNAPEKNPKRFEKLLPFAMVLGVENQWARQFEGIYTQPPEWYSGFGAGRFSASAFSADLAGFSSTACSALASPPSSAGSGGSGFSGGGGGGGFGGGGGGSW